MSNDELRDLMKKAGFDRGGESSGERVDVLVDVNTPDVGESSLARLKEIGLEVGKVIGKKITGSIPADKLEDLRADADVREVEVSRKLRPHGSGGERVKRAEVTIYHNPRCSKSRQTLQLLEDRGIEPEVISYLEDPPDAATLETILDKLGLEPIDLIRKKEEPYRALGLEKKQHDRTALIRAMVEHPVLIERPIVVKGTEARVGRPPEKVLEIL